MTNFNRDIWSDPTKLDWEKRQICLDPLESIVNNAISEYVEPDDSLVEIGSGTGFLEGLVDHRGPFIHMEGSADMVAEHRERRAKNGQGSEPVDIVQANLYELPFADKSVDNVTGLLVLDAILDAEKAFSEIDRVLKPGGKFIYFHDNIASTNAMAALARDDGMIPVPMTIYGGSVERLALFKEEQFAEFERFLRNEWRQNKELADQVIKDIKEQEQFDFFKYRLPEDIIDMLTAAIDSSVEIDKIVTPHLSEAFALVLARLAEERGLQVLRNGFDERTKLVPRDQLNPEWDVNEGINYFAHTAHGLWKGWHNEVPDGMVEVMANVLTFVTHKPVVKPGRA